MSKATWLTKPTQLKADRLRTAFNHFWKCSADREYVTKIKPRYARTFAGYYTERMVQGMSFGGHIGFLFQGVLNSRFEFARGRRAVDYRRTFDRHIPLLLKTLILEVVEEEKYVDSAILSLPIPVIADWLEERNGPEQAAEMRRWYGPEDPPETPRVDKLVITNPT